MQISAAAAIGARSMASRRSWRSWAQRSFRRSSFRSASRWIASAASSAINRRADSDALRAAVRTGIAGDVLFAVSPPASPLALVIAADHLFPFNRGTHLVGPSLKLRGCHSVPRAASSVWTSP